jgi:hypothetical protein
MRCPSCGSSYFLPSRARNLLDRLREQLSNRVLYRCQKCEQRLWVDEDALPDDEDDLPEADDEHQAQWEYVSPPDEADVEKPRS